MAQRITSFERVHSDSIVGKLTLPDRIIFRGHANWSIPRNLRVLLTCLGVLLKDFGRFAQQQSKNILDHAQKIAQEAGRPLIYLESAHTAWSGTSKEQVARKIAEPDGVTEGLIWVLRLLEPGGSFDIRKNPSRHQLGLVYRQRKCLHLYFYFLHREFGFMHVRLQTWLPLRVQVYINGREWLCRQLDQRGIGYQRYDNALVRIDDLPAAQRLARRFMQRRWPALLDQFARRVHPFWTRVRRLGFGGSYYWGTDPFELATDLMFKSRAVLQQMMPDLLRHSIDAFSAQDAPRFLGRNPSPQYQGEAAADLKRRPEGFRVKFRMKRNHIKMYDKFSVLRIETTIGNPYEFKVPRSATRRQPQRACGWVPGRRAKHPPQWVRMNKGVGNFWRYCDVGEQPGARYLDALASAPLSRRAVDELDRVCRSHTVGSRRIARLNPVAAEEARLFSVILQGQHLLNGFRNRDVTHRPYPRRRPSALSKLNVAGSGPHAC